MSCVHVMERFARMVASDQLLEVRVRGRKAYAERGRVTIPAIERFEWLGPDAERMLTGVVVHECGHASFTDFDERDAQEENNPRWNAAFHRLWNLIEDGWIERDKGAQYPGCAVSLRRLHEWMWERGLDGDHGIRDVAATGCDPNGMPLQSFTIFTALLQATLAPYGGVSLDELDRLSPFAGMLSPYLDLLGEARACASTAEAFEIASGIYDRLDKADREYTEPEDAERDADGNPDDDADDDADDAEPGAGDFVPETGKPGPMHLERYTPEPTVPANPGEAVDAALTRFFERSGTAPPYVVFSHEFDLVRDFSADLFDFGQAWDDARMESRIAAEALTSAFEVGLRASSATRAVGGHDQGEPDPELLGEYAVGACPADRIFMQFQGGDGNEVALATMLDCSGSMRGSRAMLARQAAIAIDDAVNRFQMAHMISGFTTLTSNDRSSAWLDTPAFRDHAGAQFVAFRKALSEASARGTDLHQFARAIFRGSSHDGILQLPLYGIFKSFDQSDARGLMHVEGLNHNLDGEAILWQARQLAARPEKRRVMFVLSDGQPAGSRDNEAGADFLKESIERVIASGIEVYAIAINSPHVKDYYPKWWFCKDLEDLSRIAVGALSEVLQQGRMEHEWVTIH